MLGVLRIRIYRRLFLAQAIALVGTGLVTVALGFLAFDLAGKDARAVLGTALAIKMIAYVVPQPVRRNRVRLSGLRRAHRIGRAAEPKADPPTGAYMTAPRGSCIYLATPRLRGFLAVNLAVASAGALVINTVVYVQAVFGVGPQTTALALATFRTGSMTAALALPRLLEVIPDRAAMLALDDLHPASPQTT